MKILSKLFNFAIFSLSVTLLVTVIYSAFCLAGILGNAHSQVAAEKLWLQNGLALSIIAIITSLIIATTFKRL